MDALRVRGWERFALDRDGIGGLRLRRPELERSCSAIEEEEGEFWFFLVYFQFTSDIKSAKCQVLVYILRAFSSVL